MKYTVQTDIVTGTKKGDTVTVKELPEGTNIEALVAAGHLKPATSKKDN
jgi:hypothetical protein|tara:strand:+ start:237 stop:383 length:147 start_codon:yes stop_codon:yes gene_type:complete